MVEKELFGYLAPHRCKFYNSLVVVNIIYDFIILKFRDYGHICQMHWELKWIVNIDAFMKNDCTTGNYSLIKLI